MNEYQSFNRKTILVLAYSISPIRGSEYSVGWNYVKEMSLCNDLIVLYGLAGDHMGDVGEVQFSAECQNLKGVEFIPIKPGVIANWLNFPNKMGFFVYTFYFAYRLWHKQAYLISKELCKNRNIDLIHYVCPIGYREPGYLWKIQKPYIWGPVGGVENRPVNILFKKSLVGGIKSLLKNAINVIQFRVSGRVKRAFERTDLLLSSTSETSRLVRNVHGVDSDVLPENAITQEMFFNQRVVEFSSKDTLNIIWVGSIDDRKSLDILLRALSLLDSDAWHLNVVGDGPLKEKLIRIAKEFGINEHITWAGKVSRDAVGDFFKKSHIHAITSMAEGNPTTIWEAMSFGVPTITLDHCGMHDTVCKKCGIKIPVKSLDEIVREFSVSLAEIISNRSLIFDLSTGVAECSRNFSWEHRREVWSQYYDLAISNWNMKRVGGLRA